MERTFNITGACNPREHYMVNLDSRLAEIKKMVDAGKYFVINRGRQYGKTTTLNALENYLSQDYIVVSMDFQFFDASDFENTETFVTAFAQELSELVDGEYQISKELAEQLRKITNGADGFTRMANLFKWISLWCRNTSKPIVLIIDEVDSASNNQVFLDFLAQLRGYTVFQDSQRSHRYVSGRGFMLRYNSFLFRL